MNDRKRRLRSIQIDLNEIYQDLFGTKYVPGLQDVDKSEFNSVVETFRQRLFTIRELQKQRQKNESKRGFKRTPADIKVNQNIRDQIKTCENILKEAVRRKQTDLRNKAKTKQISAKIIENRQKTLKNCFQLLKDVKNLQQGTKYQPPRHEQTLQDLKKKLVEKDEDEERIDFQDQQKFERYRKKDLQIDEGLQEVIDVNRQIKEQMKAANQKIDETGVKIQENLLKANKVEEKIKKGQRDLEQVLKNYRRPNKLCLDITLVLLLLALIGVIITMVKSSS